jgi:hypothetical protein
MKTILKVDGVYLIACLFLVVLLALGGVEHARAAGDLPYQFQAGTTIRAQEMNQNFSYLKNAMPGMQHRLQDGSVTLGPMVTEGGVNKGTDILYITVKPSLDGQILIFADVVIDIALQSPDGQGFNGDTSGVANICVSAASRSLQGKCTEVLFEASNVADARRLRVPVSLASPMYPGVTGGVNVTYYLTGCAAVAGDPSGRGSVTATRALLTALFVPGYLEQIIP